VKRRKFILLSTSALAVMGAPAISCHFGTHRLEGVLNQPLLLGHILDGKTIREIGAQYLSQNKKESREDLVGQLLKDSAGREMIPSADTLSVRSNLDQRIRNDFSQGRTMVIKGWVLSVTEVRQCALLSLGP
jgi:hypothetical protein